MNTDQRTARVLFLTFIVSVLATCAAPPPKDGVYRPGDDDVEMPRLLREATPRYTAAAMEAELEGVVLMEAIVLPDGSIGDVTVVRSLDRIYGLDEEAIKAAQQWRFLPGTRFGEPVAVRVTLEMSFTLGSPRQQ